ncbi:MAG: hypothetical protein ACYTXC_00490 [Nostoc sp.]
MLIPLSAGVFFQILLLMGDGVPTRFRAMGFAPPQVIAHQQAQN